jgi:hypothetical protein
MTRARSRAVCTMAHGPHLELLEVTGPALERYARTHGYESVVVRHRLDPTRPASWDKVVMLRELVRRNDVVMWIDADALILDDAPDVEEELSPRRFLHMVEHRVNGARVPNAGVMVLRGGPASARFLDRVWKQRQFIDHEWWENAAILHLLGYRELDGLRPVVPSVWRFGFGALDHAWNSVPADPSPAPHIVHCAGIPFAERMDHLQSYA